MRSEGAPVTAVRVLVVDDSASARGLIRALIQEAPGLTVCGEAENGRQAVEQVLALRPDIVTLDLQMPVMDGYEAIRQIRAQPALAGLPVYALSAHSGRSVLERCLALGMNGCLNKPYELSELHGVLR